MMKKKYPPEPKFNYKEVRELVSKKFPDFGYYNVPENITKKISESECVVGDAIDDIADLYIEFKRILWRFKNTTYSDALWNYHLGYIAHWGPHLRNLQWYLFNLNSER